MTVTVDPRELGRLEQRVDDLADKVERMGEKIDDLHALLQQGRGGVRVLGLIASACVAAGGLAAWVLDHLNFFTGRHP